MDLTLSEEQQSFRRLASAFLDKEAVPHRVQWDRDEAVDTSILPRMAEIGFFGLTIPEEYGGLGLPMLAKALVYETLGHTHAGFVSIIGTHCGIGTTAIVSLGSDEQKQAYLPKLATGEWMAAWGLTEAVTPNALDVALHRLRKKLLAIDSTLQVINVRGHGYALRSDAH